MDFWLSFFGSIASIIGAIYAYRQAIKSRNYATEAQKLRDEFISKRKLVEVSQVHFETNRILKLVAKVGPTCTASSIKGINVSNVAQEVEEYSRFLNAQSDNFNELLSNQASELCKSLNADIETLSEAIKFEDIKAAGKTIYYKINAFMPVAKLRTDDQKEQNSTFQNQR